MNFRESQSSSRSRYLENYDAHGAKEYDRWVTALTAADFHALTRLNYDFHARLYRANPNHSAMPLIESIWLQLGPFHREVLADLKAFYQVDRHKEILGALDARDCAALASAIRKDIEDGVGAAGRAALSNQR